VAKVKIALLVSSVPLSLTIIPGFSVAFSCSSALSRLASETVIPPNFAFQA
jgi:hypothetical protein